MLNPTMRKTLARSMQRAKLDAEEMRRQERAFEVQTYRAGQGWVTLLFRPMLDQSIEHAKAHHAAYDKWVRVIDNRPGERRGTVFGIYKTKGGK